MIDTIHATMLENLFEGVYYVDQDCRIRYWNTAAERLTGFSRKEVVGRSCEDALLRHVSGDGALLCFKGCPLKKTLDDGSQAESEVFLQHKAGHRVPISIRVAPVLDDAGEVLGAVEMFRDARKENEQEQRIKRLEAMAFLDPLTELPNRRFLLARLESRLSELKRYDWQFGILFMDVDDFKTVNDTHGHDVGDAVLKMIAATLNATVRSFDLVARYGGEEFIVIVSNVTRPQLIEIGERFRNLIAMSSLRAPEINVTVSVGLAQAAPEDTAESLIKRADEKLYAAKSTGKNRVCY